MEKKQQHLFHGMVVQIIQMRMTKFLWLDSVKRENQKEIFQVQDLKLLVLKVFLYQLCTKERKKKNERYDKYLKIQFKIQLNILMQIGARLIILKINGKQFLLSFYYIITYVQLIIALKDTSSLKIQELLTNIFQNLCVDELKMLIQIQIIYSLNFAIIIIYNPIQQTIMQANLVNDLRRERLFGKELTNLLDLKGMKNENRLSFFQKRQNNISLDFGKKNLGVKAVKVIESKNKTILSKNIELKQKKIQDDVQYVPQYFQQNLKFMFNQQKKHQILYNYLSEQKQLNQSMRVILFDWILQIHQKFKMFPQTLFIACNIIDRYLCKKQVSKSKLQLVGATALYIAAKYQQTYQVPQLDNMISLCAKAFTKSQFLQMQSSILKTLDFKLIFDSCIRFFQPFAKISNFDDKKIQMGRYILEACLLDMKMLKYKGSMIAGCSILIVNKISKQKQCWNQIMAGVSDYSEHDLKNCTKDLLWVLQNIKGNNNIKHFKRKFKAYEFERIKFNQLNN